MYTLGDREREGKGIEIDGKREKKGSERYRETVSELEG